MADVYDFLVNIAASIVWDTMKSGYSLIKGRGESGEKEHSPELLPMDKNENGINSEMRVKFSVFDIRSELTRFLSLCKHPCVHFILEDKPSTYYILPVIVLEDTRSSLWFVFQKGNLAFQGFGGGKGVQEAVFKEIQSANADVAFWIGSKESTDLLSEGKMTWKELKDEIIPLHAKLV